MGAPFVPAIFLLHPFSLPIMTNPLVRRSRQPLGAAVQA